jgi:hypothetical protein
MSDDNQLISIEAPFPEEKTDEQPALAAQPDDDAEPEGTVEVAPGRRMVDVSVVAAERKRAREIAKNDAEKELAPLREKAAKADALQQALDTVRPHLERLQQQPPPQQTAPEDSVTDAEAETYARRHQLYDANSKLDLKSAKSIIAEHRQEIDQAATRAAQQAVKPFAQNSAEYAQRQNFAAMVNELGADDILTPKQLAEQFAELGPDLSQHPGVARVALERAVGRAYLQRRGRAVRAPQREPVLSEASGGRVSQDVTLTDTGKKMGLTTQDIKDASKNFTPGGMSPIGSW